MLQQTQVDTVIPYYQRFLKNFPSIEKLAGASQQEVLKVWEGLGYYSRARNLHKAAKIIVSEYHSKLPEDRIELLTIPGFGPYTTNAVLSIAFNKPYAVVDGNVKRVLSRLFKIKDDIRDSETQNRIQEIADDLLPEDNPGDFNQALMELGATICKSSAPGCSECPLNSSCQAYRDNLAEILPFKSAKPSIPLRQSLACIIYHENQLLICQRPQNGMLAGLWEFPILSENSGNNNAEHDIRSIQEQFALNSTFIKSWPSVRHTYTHFRFKLHTKLFNSTSKAFRSDYYEDYQWLSLEKLQGLPLHKAIWKILHLIEKELITITQRNIINC
jgi:A/G-specific adenine glycosylase